MVHSTKYAQYQHFRVYHWCTRNNNSKNNIYKNWYMVGTPYLIDIQSF